jgi:8-oxo-dGTP pyrophosphatase MutT (NUDIX family)
MLNPTIEAELATLSAQYGAPIRRTVSLPNEGLFDPLGKPDRYGEVCMVIRRLDGTLLTARKTFYPPEAYRLLTGGIEHGEAIYDALLRETEEETGLDVAVRRFLAAIDYSLERAPGKPNTRPKPTNHSFHTFAFLLDELGGTLACYDPHERVEDFRDVAVADLPAMARQLRSLGQDFDPAIHGRWRDWGRFRAVIHEVVHEALTQTVPS